MTSRTFASSTTASSASLPAFPLAAPAQPHGAWAMRVAPNVMLVAWGGPAPMFEAPARPSSAGRLMAAMAFVLLFLAGFVTASQAHARPAFGRGAALDRQARTYEPSVHARQATTLDRPARVVFLTRAREPEARSFDSNDIFGEALDPK